MRYAAILAIILQTGYAQETPEAAAPAPAPAKQRDAAALEEAAAPYLELNRYHVEIMQALAEVLAPVKDAASAREAATKLAEISQKVQAMHARRAEILPEGEPDAALQLYLQEQNSKTDWDKLLQASLGRAFELLEQTPPCYGSNALQRALLSLLDVYLGEEAN